VQFIVGLFGLTKEGLGFQPRQLTSAIKPSQVTALRYAQINLIAKE
jgi:hypothetical protein